MQNNQLLQIGNLNSLMMGDYHSSCTVKDLLRYGDTGILSYTQFFILDKVLFGC